MRYPIYGEQDVDTRIALHLGICKWGIRYGGTFIGFQHDSLEQWSDAAQRYFKKNYEDIHEDVVPDPTWYPRDDAGRYLENHEDFLWQKVADFLLEKNLREQFLNCMANHCPDHITFGWWLATATAREKLDIAEEFMLRHLGNPLEKIDWERYVIRVAPVL